MITLIIAAAILFLVRSFHRALMRAVDQHGHIAPIAEDYRHDHRGYQAHASFKRRSRV